MLTFACAGGPKPDDAGDGVFVHDQFVLTDLTGVMLIYEIEVQPVPEGMNALETDWTLTAGGGRIAGDRRRIELVPRGPGGRAVRLEIPLTYLDLERKVSNFPRVSEIPCSLAGSVRVPRAGGAREIPFRHDARIPIARAPGVELASIAPGSFLSRTIQLNARAVVTNPNVFEIGIDPVTFKLMVGRIEAAELLPVESVKIPPSGTAEVSVNGSVSAGGAARQFLGGNLPGGTSLVPGGFIDTPYGRTDLKPPELPYFSPPDPARK